MDSEKSFDNWVLITTSRNPNHFLRRTAKVLQHSLPGSCKLNRGSLNINQLFSYCWNNRIPRLLILNKGYTNQKLLISAYMIGDEISLLDLTIEISEIMYQKKHDSKTRIKSEYLNFIQEKTEKSSLIKEFLTFFPKITSVNHNDYSECTVMEINSLNDKFLNINAYLKSNREKIFTLKVKKRVVE